MRGAGVADRFARMNEDHSEGTYEAPKAEELDAGGRPLESAAGIS